jgi:uncharacterized protein with WD repeat
MTAVLMQWSQTMGVLGKKSIKVKGVKEIAWSPSDNYLAYWVPEEGERPAKGQFVAFVLWQTYQLLARAGSCSLVSHSPG